MVETEAKDLVLVYKQGPSLYVRLESGRTQSVFMRRPAYWEDAVLLGTGFASV